ncbi:MAG: 50S ribosomal protein L10 [Thermoguttaceae bacterium]
MSKYVKNLQSEGVRNRLGDVQSLMVVSLVGITGKTNHALRGILAAKGIELLVVKNSVAQRAAAGTSLANGLANLGGSCALCWGTSDVVTLAKEVVKLASDRNFKGFEVCGAVLDGEPLDAKSAAEVSKWPTREEQISLLLGQIVGVGSKLSGQLIAAGGALASQIEKIGGGSDSDADATA